MIVSAAVQNGGGATPVWLLKAFWEVFYQCERKWHAVGEHRRVVYLSCLSLHKRRLPNSSARISEVSPIHPFAVCPKSTIHNPPEKYTRGIVLFGVGGGIYHSGNFFLDSNRPAPYIVRGFSDHHQVRLHQHPCREQEHQHLFHSIQIPSYSDSPYTQHVHTQTRQIPSSNPSIVVLQ